VHGLQIAAQNLNAVLKARGLPFDPVWFCYGEGACPHADGRCDYALALQKEKVTAFDALLPQLKTWFAALPISQQSQVLEALESANDTVGGISARSHRSP
jgi:hypothetical protein